MKKYAIMFYRPESSVVEAKEFHAHDVLHVISVMRGHGFRVVAVKEVKV